MRMKSMFRTGWTVVFVLLMPLGIARAQGTLIASNAAGTRTQFVTDCDGKPIGGTNYVVELLVKNPASGKFEGGLERAIGTEGWQAVGRETLRDGTLAGVFSFGTVRVPFVAPGKDAQLLFRVWDSTGGRDFAGAAHRGETNLTVRLGGVGAPPTFPTRLNGFRGLKVCAVRP